VRGEGGYFIKMQDYAITNQFIISDHGVVNDIDPKDKIFTKLNKQEDQRRYILSLAEAIDKLSSGIYKDNPEAVFEMQRIADRLKLIAKKYKIKVSMREQYKRNSKLNV
jgi:hypothetical protein